MLIRRQRKPLLLVVIAAASIWVLYVYNIPMGHHVAPVHQVLHLGLNLPKSVSDRDFIVKHYIRNLQLQLEDKEIQYQNEDEAVYAKRKEYVDKYCKKGASPNHIRVDPDFMRSKTWYLQDPNILYCPAAKSGSTFWRRAFEVMRRKNSTIVSPFQLSYLDFKESDAKIHKNFTKPENHGKLSKLLQSALKFVFAREPYHRVFSTYIDKILSPNPYMWNLGKKAITMFRASEVNDSKSCGSDVTFEEYVKYINTMDSNKFDQHIQPIAYLCDACKMGFDVIGKMESFQADTRYILRKAGTFNREIVFQDMSTEYKVDYIVDNVVRSFVFKGSWSRCISLQAGYLRLWRQLQIGGMIETTDKYPLNPEQSKNITVTEYLNLALSAFKRSSLAAKDNKRQAFLQAYSVLSLEEMEKLREHYTADFEMFDYEQRPEYLFSTQRPPRGSFDYFDVMSLI